MIDNCIFSANKINYKMSQALLQMASICWFIEVNGKVTIGTILLVL